MRWKALGILAAVALAAVAGAAPAMAVGSLHWQASPLPLPAGMPNATGYVWGHDGHGGYVGALNTAKGNVVVTWKDGRVTEHANPGGADTVTVFGESANDTVLAMVGGKLFTLDATGYHEVSTGLYTHIYSAIIGPHGQIGAYAQDPAEPQSTVALYSSPTGQAGLRPLPGALPNSEPRAIDDDGSVLMNQLNGLYVLRSGVVHQLTLPAGTHWPTGGAIKNGVVVGEVTPMDGSPRQSMMWTPPNYAPTALDHGGVAYDVNVKGVIAGAEYSTQGPEGPAAVWQGSQFQAELPLLPGTTAASARYVDDDGTVAGWASAGSPADAGQPAVWRLESDM